jgi:hypothetical protein
MAMRGRSVKRYVARLGCEERDRLGGLIRKEKSPAARVVRPHSDVVNQTSVARSAHNCEPSLPPAPICPAAGPLKAACRSGGDQD